MTLNELIYRLKAEDPNWYVRLGFSYPHSQEIVRKAMKEKKRQIIKNSLSENPDSSR